ncbi:MAG: METTL5 family protein [Candidatus Thermoplasmatota archaeon]|nr:METTL5 family protein [Candidatus Thermoplasmatota archaeon]MDP7263994.1 METTL5 family protein [Candidatus Thermoplasmatota archaeon]
MKKKRLEILLEKIRPLAEPNVKLEQYRTPAAIASEILFSALLEGHINGKNVLDLGCGSGIFTLGSAWLGANEVVGVDIDPDALDTVQENIMKSGAPEVIELFESDVNDFHPDRSFDTCIMNPPFGSQQKGADRPFLEKAMELCSTIYSLHMSDTRNFIRKFAEKRDWWIVCTNEYRFPIPHMYFFHTKPTAVIKVTCFKFEKTR